MHAVLGRGVRTGVAGVAGAMLMASAVCSSGGNGDEYLRERQAMVTGQLAARGITDSHVLDAMRTVPRHLFVPEGQRRFAYDDTPLPIGHAQTISQPYIVAFMTEALGLKPGDRVLEIGTGSGYQAAVLAELVRDVYTIEIVPELAARASELLRALGCGNIHARTGDGYAGWPEEAPFDAIIVTCAPDDIPQALIDQLAEDGRMLIPVGREGTVQELVRGVKAGGRLSVENLLPVRFVPMVRGDE